MVTYQISVKNKATSFCKMSDALEQVRTGSISKNKIVRMRSLNPKEEEYGQIKGGLPGFTFAGCFSERKKSGCAEYQYQSILDFDDLEDEDFSKYYKELGRCPHIFAYWMSPSGRGIKAIVPFQYLGSLLNMNSEEKNIQHGHAFTLFVQHLKSEHSLDSIDETGVDISRFCFDSFDPDIVIKDEVVPFVVELTAEKQSRVRKNASQTQIVPSWKELRKIQRPSNPWNRRQMKSIIKYLTKRNISITSSWSEWFKVGMGIANTFSYSIGEEYFLKLCRLDGEGHSESQSKTKLAECYALSEANEDNQETVGMGSIIWMASQKNWGINRRSL
ncbi:BT4734/BF3469 family protein [uncultured Sphaerochaeta sp.]|uniref:BT4734/BF3469 family protein n=1 Tax=uncultured Sphaerochaeta sp. TaxID=886478 RepID=UPI002A0A7FF7|nr:BT4734/BF3469 family protein [uncultured Sphaerochaeta sp.]